MLHAKARLLLCFLLVGVFYFAAPGKAHARRGGIVLITTGESIAHVEDLSPEARELAHEITGRNVQVGYAYSYAGVFWIDGWTWDGTHCLYVGDTYWPLDEELSQALLGKSTNELDTPLLYRFPPLLILLAIGGLGYGLFKLHESRQRAQLRAELLADPRYAKAADIYAAGGEEALEDALQYLESEGIAGEYACDRLAFVLAERGLV